MDAGLALEQVKQLVLEPTDSNGLLSPKSILFNFCFVLFLMKKFSKDWSDTTSFKYTCIFQYKCLKKGKERLEKHEKVSQKLQGKSG